MRKAVPFRNQVTDRGIYTDRAPFQVLVIPFIKSGNKVLYCVLERRESLHQHQFIAGGGEDDEMPLEAAKRECLEEAQIQSGDFMKLTSQCSIPVHIFSTSQREAWGGEIYVIPEYAFAVELQSENIVLSDEHVNFKWVSYDEALSKLKWDSNKTVLYELDCRLKKLLTTEDGVFHRSRGLRKRWTAHYALI